MWQVYWFTTRGSHLQTKHLRKNHQGRKKFKVHVVVLSFFSCQFLHGCKMSGHDQLALCLCEITR